MFRHERLFPLVSNGQILSIVTGATFLVLELLRGGYWTIDFSMSTVTISTAGQVGYFQIPKQNTAKTYSVLGWLVNGIPKEMTATCSSCLSACTAHPHCLLTEFISWTKTECSESFYTVDQSYTSAFE